MTEKKKTVLKTIDYIENHLNQDLKLDDISNHIGYSKFHLNRLFSETVGCTIHKYIQKRRLTVAAEKLITTNETIVEIAYEAKYESQQAFTLAFRQLYLCSPQSYRKKGEFVIRQNKFILQSKYTALIFRNEASMTREVNIA